MDSEILDALASAFHTGYSAGHNAGYWTGVVVGLTFPVLTHTLVRLVNALWTRRKYKRAGQEFEAFEKQLKESEK